MALSQAQLKAKHLPCSRAWAELCCWPRATALGDPRQRAQEGRHGKPSGPTAGCPYSEPSPPMMSPTGAGAGAAREPSVPKSHGLGTAG